MPEGTPMNINFILYIWKQYVELKNVVFKSQDITSIIYSSESEAIVDLGGTVWLLYDI